MTQTRKLPNDDLRAAIAKVLTADVDGTDLVRLWLAYAILALPEMQARDRVIEAARAVDRWTGHVPQFADLHTTVAELDALEKP